ncbi:MAG: hypothetical protein M3H12_03215, partial [Chromatiales bacterium]
TVFKYFYNRQMWDFLMYGWSCRALHLAQWYMKQNQNVSGAQAAVKQCSGICTLELNTLGRAQPFSEKKKKEESIMPGSLRSTTSPTFYMTSQEMLRQLRERMGRQPRCRDVTVCVSTSGLPPSQRAPPNAGKRRQFL